MKRLIWAVLVVLGLLALLWQWRGPEVEGRRDGVVNPASAGRTTGEEEEEAEVRLIEGSFLISDYGKGDGGVSNDLAALRDTVSHCQSLMKDFDRFHLPGNAEIIAFLQGGNPDKLAWIPLDHAFLNEEGELLDRYGTPVFFHRLSGMRFEFRSAGPDRKMWNDDDVVVK